MPNAETYRRLSNLFLATALVAGLLAIGSATGWWHRPGLSVQPSVTDLGEVAAGDKVPLMFTLLNHTPKPIRLLGANES